MIKIKLGLIINSEPVLAKLQKMSQENKLKFSASVKLTRIIARILPELLDYQKQRTLISEKFGEKTNGNNKVNGQDNDKKVDNYVITDQQLYSKYMRQLYDFEVELINVVPFDVEDLDNITELSTDEIRWLEPFLSIVISKEVPDRKPIELKFEEEPHKK